MRYRLIFVALGTLIAAWAVVAVAMTAGGWRAPAPLPVARSVSSLLLGAGPRGHAAVVAQSSRRLEVVVRDARGRLSRPLRISVQRGVSAVSPAVAVGPDGQAWVAFVASFGLSRQARIEVASCSRARCARPVSVGHSVLGSRAPLAIEQPAVAVAADKHGRVAVLWQGATAGAMPRLQWTIGRRGRFDHVHTLGEFGASPQIAFDDARRLTAVWTSLFGAPVIREAQRIRAEFGRPTTLSPRGLPASGASLAVAPNGEGVVAWLQAPRGGGEGTDVPSGPVWAARRGKRGDFGGAAVIAPGAAADFVTAGVAPSGRAVVGWAEHGPGPFGFENEIIRAALRAPGRSFSSPVVVSGPPAMAPAVAVDRSGNATVAWTVRGTQASPQSRLLAATAASGRTFAAPETLDVGPSDCVIAPGSPPPGPDAPYLRPECNAPSELRLGAAGTTTVAVWKGAQGPLIAVRPGRRQAASGAGR